MAGSVFGNLGPSKAPPGLSTPAVFGTPGNIVQTGNLMIVLVAGYQVGLAQSTDLSDDYGLERATTIGAIEAQDLVPLRADHSVDMQFMVLSKSTLYYLGHIKGAPTVLPQGGDNSDPNVVTAIRGYEFDIEVTDRQTGRGLVKYSGCKYNSGRITVAAQRIVISSANFLARHREGQFVVKS